MWNPFKSKINTLTIVNKPVSVVPQVKDYPRSVYNVYWETYYSEDNDKATVKFYDYTGVLMSESVLSSNKIDTLKDKVANLIKVTMQDHKR